MQQKLQFNFFLFILIGGLLLLEGRTYAQTNPDQAPAETKPAVNDGEEAHDTKDLEQLLKRYNTDQDKVLDDASKIHNIENTEGSTEIDDADIEEMRPDDVLAKAKEASLKKVKKDREEKARLEALKVGNSELSNAVRKSLLPLQGMEEAELIKILKANTKDSAMGPYFDKFPHIMLFSVRLIKDKESIPSLVKIVEKKDRLIHFSGWMIGTIIIAFFLKRFFRKDGRSFIASVGFFFLRFYIMLAIRIALIYFYFHEEFAPAAAVFKKTFL